VTVPSFLRVLHIPQDNIHHWGGTCLYLAGVGDLTLIDTGNVDQAGSKIVNDYLEKYMADGVLRSVMITHCHRDHVGGLQSVYDRWRPRVYAHPLAVDTLKSNWDFADAIPLLNGEVMESGGICLKVLYMPGHSADHLCFSEPSSGIVFTGDLVVGKGTAMITDLAATLASLRQLLEMEPTLLCPGHGPVIADGIRRIRWYIARRLTRERQLLHLLRRTPASFSLIMGATYPGLDEKLHHAAENSIMAHLRKLENEGRVGRSNTGRDTVYFLTGKIGTPNDSA
jgi:endoribonuclease LACTB2